MARFSYMGGSNGPLSYQVRYDLRARMLEATYPDGRRECRADCDVLEFLEGQLLACKLAAPEKEPSGGASGGVESTEELPFEFAGGFVGYLGYELKELCEDGLGEKNKHIAEEPDAVLLFADRFLVWDHEKACIYAVALTSGDAAVAAAAAEWLAATEAEVERLSSLSLRDTLAERHQAVREPAQELARGRHACPPHATAQAPPAAAAAAERLPSDGVSSEEGHRGAGSQPHGDSVGVAEVQGGMEPGDEVNGEVAGEERASGDEPPTVVADDSDEQEPSHSPSGPGALSFPPIKPIAPSPSAGPGMVPRGAMPHAEGVQGSESAARCCGARSRGVTFVAADTSAQYQAKVRRCLGYIVEGESYELCLTTRHRWRSLVGEHRPSRIDPLRFYQRLRTVNPAPYSALLRCGHGLTVCSSSPERFLRISRRGLCDSKPIKGTRRRGACAQEDAEICQELRTCEKDLAENLMIVDLVRNDLGRVCTDKSVCCPKLMDVESYATVRPASRRALALLALSRLPFILKCHARVGDAVHAHVLVCSCCVYLCLDCGCTLGCLQVHQLVSTIQGQMLPCLTSVDVVRATFPMGSMTGAPKRRSLALLDELESDARGIYSGVWGLT